ncbi:tRNA pseudouridine(38-40) synthase TruA [Oenococcus sicerae]|uniref:tRNA pseudouridine synthase A n=1 Tax=Oenococcus sicerae TaxID=2203724 RepID=A0AAJ1RDJ2_9LACO|nr:tRNA pseudouridine(38-40) synthase TruA [Oenococcus sicerae]MDN6901035.1 tRNA pseudouridine(38-40) synthase TruA [Oenococcus sicerae]QAS70638.1 tRNA pseudouridine(38-40) synthase TruA [Oenococcus sicerae]VDK14610.1 tRNA pseudouridine synthase A [Oenococcus sicerae]
MQNYKLTISYDGHAFEGFQTQNRPGCRTVQDELIKVVSKMAKTPVKIVGASRTDAGVHANGQVINFVFPFDLTERAMLMGINSQLPTDILVKNVEKVQLDFNARHSSHHKRYLYRVSTSKFVDPFKRFYTGHYFWRLDFDRIQAALPDLLGEHDFASFAAAGNQTATTVRRITKAELKSVSNDHELLFTFEGNAFLYNQIRIMVGVLLEIGNGTRPVHDIERLIQVKDRQQARFTAPASGLYLDKVYYESTN